MKGLVMLNEQSMDVAMLRIGDLVDRFGVSAESLRNWERSGLIPSARRTPGGHRRYGLEHVRALESLLGMPVAFNVRAAPA